MNTIVPTRITAFLTDIITISRPFWWISPAAAFATGSLLTTGRPDAILILGTLYFTLPFNLLLYGINDIFDYETDIRNPRKSGIDGSVLDITKHRFVWRAVLVTNLPFWYYFVLIGTPAADGLLLLIVLMALAYSVKGVRFKEVPVLDSLTSSFHYTAPYLLAILLQRGHHFWWLGFASFFIWIMADHAFGAIQDITPDRQAGVRSVAVTLGAPKTIIFCASGYSIAAILPLFAFGKDGLLISLLLLPFIYLVISTWPQRHNPEAAIFRRNWKLFLMANYLAGGIMAVYLTVRLHT